MVSIPAMNAQMKKPILCAIGAAILYALHTPVSKYLLLRVQPTLLASFLYLGAGLGIGILYFYQNPDNLEEKDPGFERKDLIYVVLMVVLDIAAPICLLIGLFKSSPSTVSLLNNFEIVATVLIAAIAFREAISFRLWISLLLVIVASIMLSVQDFSSIRFTAGSLYVLLAGSLWGFENNCTRQLSRNNPLKIVCIKGLGSGFGSFIIAMVLGESLPQLGIVLISLLLGFISYGLSISLYIYAQRDLGAARTSSFYALAPFIGAIISLILYQELPTVTFSLAFALMGAGTILSLLDSKTPMSLK
jgi:drug/metabolite transporter (DMT)-like permease